MDSKLGSQGIKKIDSLGRQPEAEGVATRLNEVAHRAQTHLDLSLINLMASAAGDKTAELVTARKLAAFPASWTLHMSSGHRLDGQKPLWLSLGLGAPSANHLYKVFIENKTGGELTEAIAFWRSPSAPIAGSVRETRILDGHVRALHLGRCDLMVSYALGVFVGSQCVGKIPPSGEMTPQMASQAHPSDDDPCADSWLVEGQFVPIP